MSQKWSASPALMSFSIERALLGTGAGDRPRERSDRRSPGRVQAPSNEGLHRIEPTMAVRLTSCPGDWCITRRYVATQQKAIICSNGANRDRTGDLLLAKPTSPPRGANPSPTRSA